MAWDKDLDKNSSAYKFACNDAKTIRVMAGPGTGKSFGLKRRVARLLEQGVTPNRILAVTFTRTAAQDLKEEIQSIEVDGADKVVAKTLHSYCFKMLQKKEIITATGRTPRPLLDFEVKPMLYDLDKKFGKIREKEKILQKFEASWACLQSDIPGFTEKEIYKEFETELNTWLIKHKAMLFGEMISETYHYLRNNPLCPEKSDFDYILVDEYQDLNKAEQSVIDYLASNCNLAVIGDDDQSIYSFKYAHPEGIREFSESHPDCITIDFAECRRCPQKVVQMASRLISHNSNRTLGKLVPFNKNQEGNVQIVQCKTLQNEIDNICKIVYDDINNGIIEAKDVLILVPVKKIGKKVRETLVQLGLPAKTYFRESQLDSDKLKYNFSLFTLLSNPDDVVSLRYLLGFGEQSFRNKSYRILLDYSIKNNMELPEILDGCLEGNMKIPGISTLVQRYKQIKEQLNELKHIAQEGQDSFVNYLTSDIPDSDEFRSILLESIKECNITVISDFESSLEKIYNIVVEKISRPNVSSKIDQIKIMTLHASKGLSSKYVVVMSAIDELIPRNGNNTDFDKIEEQRRLFYVAITRCKSSENEYPGKLIISSFTGLPGKEALELNIAANANQWKTVRASRFIRDFENTAPLTVALQ